MEEQTSGFFRIDVFSRDGWTVDIVFRSDGLVLIDVEGANGEDALFALPPVVADALGAALVEVAQRALNPSKPQ